MIHSSLRLTVVSLALAGAISAGIGTATADVEALPAETTLASSIAGGTGSSDLATGSGQYIFGPLTKALAAVYCAVVPGSAQSALCV
ncbi:hypothetical protein [Nocardia inohanensis]|uniref:hypothetical protein n=1 Tax=Nocardia inohanensis TaxID=209246 RepID=UPI000833140D|nr:hypothetical protein [Nocardia inohanensis]